MYCLHPFVSLHSSPLPLLVHWCISTSKFEPTFTRTRFECSEKDGLEFHDNWANAPLMKIMLYDQKLQNSHLMDLVVRLSVLNKIVLDTFSVNHILDWLLLSVLFIRDVIRVCTDVSCLRVEHLYKVMLYMYEMEGETLSSVLLVFCSQIPTNPLQVLIYYTVNTLHRFWKTWEYLA